MKKTPPPPSPNRVVAEACRHFGYKMHLHKLPGERTLMQANSLRMEGELYRKVGMEHQYPNLILLPVPVLTYDVVMFTLGTDFAVHDWESLRPFTIGFVRGIKIVHGAHSHTKRYPC